MVFIIKPIAADLTGDHDIIGKSDPYCIILIGDQKYQTKAHNGGGNSPKWTQVFTFNGVSNELKVQVYDEDVGKDDFYGEGVLDLSKWITNAGKQQTDCVHLQLKGKKAGLVTLTIQYQANANNLGWGNTQSSTNTTTTNSTSGNPGSLGY